MEPIVEVIQADRDAAADWCEAQPFPSKQAEAPLIREGSYDHHSLVTAMAKHRLSTPSPAPKADNAALREALEQIIPLLRATDALQANGFADDAVRIARAALQATEPRP